jgi:DNA-binding MarR family transcriptional regulator
VTAKGKPAATLDPVIHPITRLSICGLLASGADWVEFAALRDAAGISDSVLSKQSRLLEDAGYVEVRKGAVGRRPRTWFRLTPNGREAFQAHVAWLQQAARVPPEDATDDAERATHGALRRGPRCGGVRGIGAAGSGPRRCAIAQEEAGQAAPPPAARAPNIPGRYRASLPACSRSPCSSCASFASLGLGWSAWRAEGAPLSRRESCNSSPVDSG